MPAHHLLSSHVECVRGRSSKDELRWTLKFKFETWLERSCRALESESEVAHSCLTLSDPMDCSLPGSSVHGIFQARVLEHVTISFSTLRCLLLKQKTSQMVITPSVCPEQRHGHP